MRIFTLTAELTLPLPIDRVFAFFADAGNLEAITPDSLSFHILTPRPIPMHPGAIIDYRLRLMGIPFRWRTLIEEWNPPHRFVDRQLRGPYRLWHHTHTFEPAHDPVSGEESTLVRDFVRYAVPLGAIPRRLFVLPQINAIFAHRQRRIAHLLLGRSLAAYPPIRHGEEAAARPS
ncbi:MAG: CDP-paratose 2-epimerase [Phycisphaerales bacterium]